MIETERLTLSAWTEAEREPFVAMTADPEVMHDYGGAWDHARSEERFERHAAGFAERGFDKWALRTRSDGAFAGICGVGPVYPTLPVAPGLEIGRRLVRAKLWGHGYASEVRPEPRSPIPSRVPTPRR